MTDSRPLAHLKISTGTQGDILAHIEDCITEGKRAYCVPLNVTKYVLSKKDSMLRKVINLSDYVIADGIPIVWLSRRAGYCDVHRVTGIDLAEAILSMSHRHKWRLFFLGASPENLQQAIMKLTKRFCSLNIVGCHHGYFKQDGIETVIDKINDAKPDILLLGLGMPQKEYFIRDHFGKIEVKFCLPVGGAFDVWAGVKKRTPGVVQRIGLEWLYRSFYDKTRALNIAHNGPRFLADLVFYKQR